MARESINKNLVVIFTRSLVESFFFAYSVSFYWILLQLLWRYHVYFLFYSAFSFAGLVLLVDVVENKLKYKFLASALAVAIASPVVCALFITAYVLFFWEERKIGNNCFRVYSGQTWTGLVNICFWFVSLRGLSHHFRAYIKRKGMKEILKERKKLQSTSQQTLPFFSNIIPLPSLEKLEQEFENKGKKGNGAKLVAEEEIEWIVSPSILVTELWNEPCGLEIVRRLQINRYGDAPFKFSHFSKDKLWIQDPGTDVNIPWMWEDSESKNYLRFFLHIEKFKGRAPVFEEGSFMQFLMEQTKDVLIKVGIFTTQKKIEERIEEWNRNIKSLRRHFEEKGWVRFGGIFSDLQIQSFKKYYSQLREKQPFSSRMTLVDDGYYLWWSEQKLVPLPVFSLKFFFL